MGCTRSYQLFKITGVPASASAFMNRLNEVEGHTGAEVALYEPKKGEQHQEGGYYVGVMMEALHTRYLMEWNTFIFHETMF